MGINQIIAQDLYRYYGDISSKGKIKAVLSHSGARFMFLYRMCARYPKNNVLGIIFRFWFNRLSKIRNVEIPHKVKFGEGLYFGHFMNIVINQNVIVGKNCNIMQGVTVGYESRGKRKGSPVIGDRVLIGPNSVVVGNITIGNDVLIGPLTLVNFDIADNSVVVGNPAKIVSQKGSIGYVNKIL